MYRHIDPPTTPDSFFFSAASGMVCGAIYAFLLDGMWTIGLGGLFGLVGGILLSPLIIAVLRQGSIEHAGWIGLLPALGLSILLGMYGMNPILALFTVATSFAVLCALSTRLYPATRPIDPFTCENCGYDLDGVKDITCPECGRERIVMPKNFSKPDRLRSPSQFPAEAHRAMQDPNNLDVVSMDKIENQELPEAEDGPSSQSPEVPRS